MASETKKFWALVKWIGGSDDKTYTVGIDINHIKNFDLGKFCDDEEDPNKIYVIEWHDTPKEPLGGWICYNAKIIAVSSSRAVLNKKLKALDGVQSPKSVCSQENFSNYSKQVKAHSSSQVEEKNNDLIDLSQVQDEDNDDINFETDGSSLRKRLNFDKTILPNSIPEIILNTEDNNLKKQTNNSKESNNGQKVNQINIDHKLYDDDSNTNTHQQFITKDDLKKALNEINNLITMPSTSRGHPKVTKDDNNLSTKQHMKEIGESGSNVFVTEAQYSAAHCASSPTAIATSLLTSVFEREVLLVSNYKDGKPKNAREKNIKYDRLDEHKINAIKDEVKVDLKRHSILLILEGQ